MQQPKQATPDRKTLKIWKHHLQEEVDASFLYSVFASLESEPRRKEILSELAEVENQHVIRWEEMLTIYNVKLKKLRPTSRAQLIAWYARRFGTAVPLSQMLSDEASEVKDYLTLHLLSVRAEPLHWARCDSE